MRANFCPYFLYKKKLGNAYKYTKIKPEIGNQKCTSAGLGIYMLFENGNSKVKNIFCSHKIHIRTTSRVATIQSVWRCFLLVIYDASRLYVRVYSSSYRLNKEVSTSQDLVLCASLDTRSPDSNNRYFQFSEGERKTKFFFLQRSQPTLAQFWSLKIRHTSFQMYIKFVPISWGSDIENGPVWESLKFLPFGFISVLIMPL